MVIGSRAERFQCNFENGQMNCIDGEIQQIECYDGIALIDVRVNACILTASVLGSAGQEWRHGQAVRASFRETDVAIAKQRTGMISMRNCMRGSIAAIEKGKVLTRVDLDCSGLALSSIITTRAASNMNLAVGDEVEALVKANEISLEAHS